MYHSQSIWTICTYSADSFRLTTRTQGGFWFFLGEDGTGLGLVISRKIIESYGGTITITDSEEGGACFTVFLPEPGQDEIIEEITP